MRPFIFTVLILLGACAADPAGWPQGMGQLEFKDFLRADTDGSGKLNPAEAGAFPAVARDFPRYDADGDGLIAWTELRRVGGLVGDRQSRFEPELRQGR